MKNMFYVAKELRNAICFIEVNTDWKKTTSVSFRNGDENITVISDFNRIRGREVDGVYVDYTFSWINPNIRSAFQARFDALGIQPVILEDKMAHKNSTAEYCE